MWPEQNARRIERREKSARDLAYFRGQYPGGRRVTADLFRVLYPFVLFVLKLSPNECVSPQQMHPPHLGYLCQWFFCTYNPQAQSGLS